MRHVLAPATLFSIAEQELQKKVSDMRNAEKALRRQMEDQETAVRVCRADDFQLESISAEEDIVKAAPQGSLARARARAQET